MGAAPANYTIPLPDSMSTKTAAASLLQALTAVTLIRDAYTVQKGDWILVTAAAGGVGLWLCQLLKAVGARVIATASTEEKRNLAKQNGAEVLLEYHEEDRDVFVKKVLEVTGGLSAKNVKLLRPTLFNYIATREELQAAANELWKFIEKDGLNVKIHDVYPLSEIVRATKDIEGRKTT